ncbi:EamA family transporter [Paenibacillus montanisoli]|uniref:EamA/RhaT family transporter n=1 Tax=Paenibacillus montanisoli TaxID=2081970 RepID=A0A328TY78_9BACL|nr:EamA family transporter [Paenibacillus montanisoli]RAP75409.1 EamA/RhaT family transporter [Paenibacillus montanisoli]
MWFAAAVGSAVLFGLAGWWMKVSQMQSGSSAFLLLGLYISGTFGFGIHAAMQHTLVSSLSDPRVWIAGLLIGAGSALGNALFMKALEWGPASLTSPLTNMNILLVVALGTFVYGEALSVTELGGIILLLLAIVLVSIRGKTKETRIKPRWYFYIGVSIVLFAVRNGGLKVTGDLGLESAPILFAAYGLSVLWFAAASQREWSSQTSLGGLPAAARAGTAAIMRRSLRSLSIGMKWGLVAGLFSYGGLQLYAIALETGRANIAGPIFAANSLVVAAGAILLYRERLNVYQTVAFALTIAGLVLIRM